MPRVSLRQGLERDVYQLVRKYEDELDQQHDGSKSRPPPRITVSAVYDYIRNSNSSLGRQKRKILEDSIERVLQFRKQDLLDQESDDDDDEGGVGAEQQQQTPKPATDSSLLNRQLARRWKLAEKKEKEPEHDDKAGSGDKERSEKMSGSKKRRRSRSPSALGTARTTTNGDTNAAESQSRLVMPKRVKTNKGFKVADLSRAPVVGGVDHLVADFERDILPEMVPRITDGEDEIMIEDGQEEGNQYKGEMVSLLLSGPMGCGKSALLQHLASRWKIPLVKVDCRYLEFSDRVERTMADVYDEAFGLAPCIVQFSRLDSLWGSTGSSQVPTNQAEHHVRDLMLRFAETRDAKRPIAIVGTTNQPEKIPRYMFMEKLFESIYSIKAPNEAVRAEILRTLGEAYGFPDSLDYTAVAHRTHGFVADDIHQIVKRCSRAAGHARRLVAPEDLDKAAREHVPHLYHEGFSETPDVTLDQVGGLGPVKELLELNIINRIKHPDHYVGVSKPAGVLLWGPPGCGKTYVAQAIANAAQASFILVNGPELLDKYVGESERKIRALFSRARTCAPCLIFLDEIDSLVPRRENTSTEAGTRVVNTFLSELDGAKSREGVYVIAATNRPDMIDPAMFRTGRFNRKVYVDVPSEEERVDILRTIVRSRGIRGGAEVAEAVARDPRCADFSGADLSELSDRAVLECVRRTLQAGGTPGSEDAVLTKGDWEAAMRELKPSVKDIAMYRTMAKAEEKN